MKEFIYSGNLLILSLPFFLFLFAAKKQRPLILISGFLALPQALYSLILVPEYWNPKRIYGTAIGLEDFLFSFFAGGLAWFFAAGLSRINVGVHFSPSGILHRFIMTVFFAALVGIPLSFTGLQKMEVIFLVMILWAIFLQLYIKRHMLFLASGSFFFTLCYVICFRSTLLLWPDYISFWTSANLWGLTFLKIPLEEIIWAGLFSAAWPMTVVFILQLDRAQSPAGMGAAPNKTERKAGTFIGTELY